MGRSSPKTSRPSGGHRCPDCSRTCKSARGLEAHRKARHRRGPGRPSKLTQELVDTLTGHLQEGLSIPSSIALAGITERTYYDWLALGEKQLAGEEIPNGLDAEVSYADFHSAVKRALAEAEIVMLGTVRAGRLGRDEGDRAWQSAAWWLERRNPDAYGKREKHELSGPGGSPIKQEVQHDAPPSFVQDVVGTLREAGLVGGDAAPGGDDGPGDG